jgi:hypothetical protein
MLSAVSHGRRAFVSQAKVIQCPCGFTLHGRDDDEGSYGQYGGLERGLAVGRESRILGEFLPHPLALAREIGQPVRRQACFRALPSLPLDRFDRRRPFAPWLHRIAVNRAIDWARARELRREVELVETAGGAAVGDDGHASVVGGAGGR